MNIVYILKSLKDQSYYIGVTTDLKRRLHEHNTGSNKYSSSKSPFKIIWFCAFANKEKSLKFEKYLKHGSGHAFRIKHLI